MEKLSALKRDWISYSLSPFNFSGVFFQAATIEFRKGNGKFHPPSDHGELVEP